jgi:hypothetical protein
MIDENIFHPGDETLVEISRKYRDTIETLGYWEREITRGFIEMGELIPNPYDEPEPWLLDHLCKEVYDPGTGYIYHEVTYSISFHNGLDLGDFAYYLGEALKEEFKDYHTEKNVRVRCGVSRRDHRYGRRHFITIGVSHGQYDLE